MRQLLAESLLFSTLGGLLGGLLALGIPLQSGRLFSPTDRRDSQPVALINQTMARRFWPGQDPVSRRFTVPSSFRLGNWEASGPEQPVTVIGVVGDVKQYGLNQDARPTLYRPHQQTPWIHLTLMIRTSGDPMQMVEAVKAAVWSVDGDVPIWGSARWARRSTAPCPASAS